MSRLIVKNLPNNITTEKLRDIFVQKGEITDVQLKYTREGKFRNFGFIGFRTEEQATAARDYFNGTCIKSSRIVVESCTALGSAGKPKAWSKYAPDSSAFKKLHGVTKEIKKRDKAPKKDKKNLKKENSNRIKEILKTHKNDPLFSEFLDLHASKINKDLLVDTDFEDSKSNNSDRELNEDVIDNDDGDEQNADTTQIELKEKLANKRISDYEYMKSLIKDTNEDKDKKSIESKKRKPANRILYTVKIQGMSYASKKKDIKDFFRPLIPFTIRIPREKSMRGFCYVGFRSEDERKKALFKNRSFLGGHRVTVDSYNKKNTKEQNEDEERSIHKRKEQEESLKHEETIAESGKIYIRNLPYITTEDELQELFQKFGPVTETNMPVDKITHRPKGFAHITFMMPEHAVKAYSELDGTIFCGRMLHLLPGKQKEDAAIDDESLTYKQKKELKQKAQSGSAHNWNSLFLGANALADVIADSYNTTKEKLLEGNSKMSAAVKLALGETEIVSNTRKFLEDSGVYLEAFNQVPTKRSKTIILIKNLPCKTNRTELLDLFEPFGLIARLIMPPHGISGLVEFVEPSEARKAFSKLAYTKFKYLPLYLEWAPDNAFVKPADVVKRDPENTPTEVDLHDEDDVPEAETILFVKGLNFDTREDELRKHFETCGRLHSVTVAMKKDPVNPGQQLSMGYGFVQFYRKSAIEKALKNLQLSTLNGKQIELKRSERNGSNADVKTTRKVSTPGKQTGTKIMVRNIPFQANRREIYEVFGAFGEIKAVRLPKKMVTGEDRHKGFCFVEYHNNSDAKKAFNQLCQSTHLYGRRLVLEWAKLETEDDMVDSLRKRTAETYYTDVPGGKKTKKSLVTLEGMEEQGDE